MSPCRGKIDRSKLTVLPQDPDVEPYLTLCQRDTLIYASPVVNGDRNRVWFSWEMLCG